MLKKIHSFIYKLSAPKYILVMSLLCYVINNCVIGEITMALGDMVGITSHSTLPDDLNRYFWFSLGYAVLIAPFIETFLFQSVPMAIINKIRPLNRYTLFIIADALVFGLMHGGAVELQKKIMAFGGGIVFAYTYTMFKEKNYHPFIITVAVHAMNNFYSVAYVLFERLT